MPLNHACPRDNNRSGFSKRAYGTAALTLSLAPHEAAVTAGNPDPTCGQVQPQLVWGAHQDSCPHTASGPHFKPPSTPKSWQMSYRYAKGVPVLVQQWRCIRTKHKVMRSCRNLMRNLTLPDVTSICQCKGATVLP